MNTTLIAILGAALLVFGGLAMGVYQLLNPTRTSRDRVSELTGGPKKDPNVDELSERIAKRIGDLAATKDIEDADALRIQLIRAGYKSKNAPQVFNTARVAMAIFLPLMAAPFAASMDLSVMALVCLLGAGAGYYAPQLIVNSREAARKMEILKPFPDALDLLVTCVEAGLGLDAALKRVAFEMETTAPLLSQEFMIVIHEMSAGVPRMDALKHLGERTGVEEIISLVNMLVQADRFGTSIAHSLRIHGEVVRKKRMSRAEEEAAAVSPKLTVVMILFLMPTLMVVLLGPACINVRNTIF